MLALDSQLSIRLKGAFLLLFTLLFMLSCSAVKKKPLEHNGNSIIFGDGGGFSGIENSILINDDGKIYELKNRRSSYSFIKKMDSNDVDQLFNVIDVLGIMDIELNSPGNSYKFIELKMGESEKRLVWSASNASEDIKILYKILHTKAQLKL